MLQALASLTGLAVNDQLLIFGGQRLEPSKTLASRDLSARRAPPAPPANAPDANAATRDVKPRHVFLYSKALLRPDAPLPPSEPLESVVAEPAPPAPRGDGTHPLESASSPLVRALPDYERQFRHHRQRVASTWRATQSRFDACKRLVTEMHVQALAIEGARLERLRLGLLGAARGPGARRRARRADGVARRTPTSRCEWADMGLAPRHAVTPGGGGGERATRGGGGGDEGREAREADPQPPPRRASPSSGERPRVLRVHALEGRGTSTGTWHGTSGGRKSRKAKMDAKRGDGGSGTAVKLTG